MSSHPADRSFESLLRQAEAQLSAGRFADAEAALRTVLATAPRHAQALHLLGLVALSAGHAQDAERLIADSLAQSSTAKAHVNRALALNALSRFGEAVDACRAALSLDASLVSAYINQAGPLQALGRIDEAVAVLEQAVAREPQRAEAHNNLGNLYKEQGRIDDALRAYREALTLQPQMQEAFSNWLATSKLCDDLTPEQNLNRHQAWSAWFETGGRDYQPFTNSPDADRKLRVAYLSPDCHTAVPAFIRPVWRHHDLARIELFAYFNHRQSEQGPLPLPGTARVMAGLSDAEIARQIRADGIDVLIDLAGHTGRNRLGVIGREAAPVQITWLDYLGTTGLRNMHWRLTDAVADPPGVSEAAHSEQLLCMPYTQWCWEPPANAPAVSALPALQTGALTFGSFNNFSKLTHTTRAAWRELMLALPTAQLLVAGAPAGEARTRFLADLGAAAARVRFAPRVDEAAYRALFSEVDIALDPTPFSGATTSLDAYWQGVPVVTLGGPFSWSRSTASLSAALGLQGWVFDDVAAMIAALRVVENDLPALAELRSGLRTRVAQSSIVNAAEFTTALEANIRRAWSAWCAECGACNAGSRAAWDRDVGELKQRNAQPAHADRAAENLRLAIALHAQRPSTTALHVEIARAALAAVREVPQTRALAAADRVAISFLICSIKPDKLAAITRRIHERFAGHDVEVIGITDARSLAEAYNRGAQSARGAYLVFCHDDIDLPQADVADRLLAALARADLVGVAGCSRLVDGHWEHAGFPHLHGQIVHRPPDGQGFLYFCAGLQAPMMTGLKALDGVFMACSRKLWAQIHFDEQTFDGFHLYDIDFSLRASEAGFNVAVSGDLLLIHDSLGKYDAGWQRTNRRFLDKFPAIEALPNPDRPSSLHVRLGSWEHVERLHAALSAHRFGAET